jgi:ABC-type phosphate/phosphonate transport system substrate-binding protein
MASTLLLCLCFNPIHAQSEETVTLRVGFLEYTIFDVSLEDTRVAINLYLEKVLKGTRFEPETVFFQNIADLRQALQNHTIEMASISSIDFLRLSSQSPLVPSTIRVSEDNSVFNTYTLLVHKDKNWSSLADLQNAHIRFLQKEPISAIWMDVMLAENKLPKAPQFFKKVTKDERASKAVLSVFFNQADACIVTTRNFQIMSELNPQIAQALTSIALSPEYLPGLLCFHKEFSLSDREVLEHATLGLANTEEGKQVLKLFKTKKVIKVTPAHLETISQLLAQYEKYYGSKSE